MPYKTSEARREYQKKYNEEHKEEIKKKKKEYNQKMKEERLRFVMACPVGTVVREGDK
jgi:high-affinity Fe2+/Pb2+ permease